jgi:hypothetical protein
MKRSWVPPVLPVDWRKFGDFGPSGAAYQSPGGLRVIATESEHGDYADESVWLHVSVSRANQLPSYEDLVTVKEIFIGCDAKAIMVFPPRDKHVNIHPNCLHLFSCLTGDPLPEFSGELAPGVRTL